MSIRHKGGCRCGAVRFESSGEPHQISYCHCGDCRHATGAPVTAFVGFRKEALTFSGESPPTYGNAPVTRGFCGTCGSPLFYFDDRLPNHIYCMLGAMDRPSLYEPTMHAYVQEQLPFLHMPDGLPRHLKTSVPRPNNGTTA